MVNPLYMLFLVYNTSFDKSILTLKTRLYAIIFLRKREKNMKKRRRLKKKIRNRLILAFGLLITLFILITLIKGIVGLFHSDNKTSSNEKITEEVKGSETLRKAGMSEEDIKEMTSLPNYHSNRAKRYAKWKADSVKEIVMQVNCDMDLKPYSKTTIAMMIRI